MSKFQEITIPDIGDADEVEVIEIQFALGDSVSIGDVLLTVESDKAAMDIPSQQTGRLTELVVTVGDKVKQGQLFAKLELVDEITTVTDAPGIDQENQDPVQSDKKVESIAPIANKTQAVEHKKPESSSAAEQQHWAPAGPASRRLARELGLDISLVVGSGRRGRIFKEDVKAHANTLLSSAQNPAGATAFAAAELPDLSGFGSTRSESLSKIEQVTSRNMQRAWREIPHAWLQQNVDITELDQGRKRLKAEHPNVTLTALVIKAIALGLQEFPRFNCVLDAQAQQLLYRAYIHVGVAVDTPRGLVIAVIRDAAELTVKSIGAELSRLSALAREGKLLVADMQGASMTVSSLGGLGIDGLQPIVNWPEVAILGVAKASIQPVCRGDQFEPRLMLPMTLAFDHRVINGADGARFLSYVKNMLSDPMRLMVNS